MNELRVQEELLKEMFRRGGNSVINLVVLSSNHPGSFDRTVKYLESNSMGYENYRDEGFCTATLPVSKAFELSEKTYVFKMIRGMDEN
jgi:hypothetical protein